MWLRSVIALASVIGDQSMMHAVISSLLTFSCGRWILHWYIWLACKHKAGTALRICILQNTEMEHLRIKPEGNETIKVHNNQPNKNFHVYGRNAIKTMQRKVWLVTWDGLKHQTLMLAYKHQQKWAISSRFKFSTVKSNRTRRFSTQQPVLTSFSSVISSIYT